jgi:hypothetical protein
MEVSSNRYRSSKATNWENLKTSWIFYLFWPSGQSWPPSIQTMHIFGISGQFATRKSTISLWRPTKNFDSSKKIFNLQGWCASGRSQNFKKLVVINIMATFKTTGFDFLKKRIAYCKFWKKCPHKFMSIFIGFCGKWQKVKKRYYSGRTSFHRFCWGRDILYTEKKHEKISTTNHFRALWTKQ